MKTPGQSQDRMEGLYMSLLGWGYFRIPEQKLEDVVEIKDFRDTPCSVLPSCMSLHAWHREVDTDAEAGCAQL